MIWKRYAEESGDTASLNDLCDCLGISKKKELAIISFLLEEHSWLNDSSYSYIVDHEGFKRMVQYVNERNDLLVEFYVNARKEQEKKKAELLEKFYEDIIDRFNNKPEERINA